MPTYNVKSPVKINGKLVKDGTVDLAEKAAAALVESGSLELAPDAEKAGGQKKSTGGKGAAG